MSIERFYEIHATVQQWIETSTELGINILASTWTVLANIDGALELLSKGERFIEGTDRIVGTHRFFAVVNTSVVEENRIIIGSDTYEIRSIENPMEMGHHMEIVMEIVK